MPRVRRSSAVLLVCAALLAGCKIRPDAATPTAEPAATSEPQAAEAGLAEAPATTPPAPPPAPAPLPAPIEPPSGVPIEVATVTAPDAWRWDDPATRTTAANAAAERLRAWLLRTGRAAVLLALPANYAWLSAGADNDLGLGSPRAVLAITPERSLVLAPSDTIRTARRSLTGLGFLARTYRWDLGADPAAPVKAIAPLVGTGPLAADTHRPGTEYVAEELTALRERLGEPQQTALRGLGRRVAEVVAETVAQATPETTAVGLRSQLIAQLTAAGLQPLDVRVTPLAQLPETGLWAGDETTLASGAAIHVVGGRGGLSVALGRTITFGDQPEATEAYVRARRVMVGLLAAVRVGVPLRELYRAAERAADAAGESKLFQRVSPGGVGAFEPSALPLAPQAEAALAAGQCLVLRAPLDRAYLADTYLVQSGKVELLTWCEGWPSPAEWVNGREVPMATLRGAEEAVREIELRRQEIEARRAADAFLGQLLSSAVERAARTTPLRPTPPAEKPPAASAPQAPPVEAPAAAPSPGPPADATPPTGPPEGPTSEAVPSPAQGR